MRTSSPPSLSITCVAMDNVGRILKDRHISVNGLLALIHDRHPDCGLPYSILRRLVSHERKMSIDEAILICDALDIPFTALFDFAGEVPHGPLKGMTSADIYRACDAAGTWHTIGNEPYARAELDEGLYSSRWQRASTPGRRYLTAMAENRRRYAEFDVGNRKTTWKDAGRSVHGTRFLDQTRTDLFPGAWQGRFHRPGHGRIHSACRTIRRAGIRRTSVQCRLTNGGDFSRQCPSPPRTPILCTYSVTNSGLCWSMFRMSVPISATGR